MGKPTDYIVKDISLADFGRKEIDHRRDRNARPDGDRAPSTARRSR